MIWRLKYLQIKHFINGIKRNIGLNDTGRNQVLISNLMAQVRGKGDVKPNKEMIRHMVLTSLRGLM